MDLAHKSAEDGMNTTDLGLPHKAVEVLLNGMRPGAQVGDLSPMDRVRLVDLMNLVGLWNILELVGLVMVDLVKMSHLAVVELVELVGLVSHLMSQIMGMTGLLELVGLVPHLSTQIFLHTMRLLLRNMESGTVEDLMGLVELAAAHKRP